MRTRLVPIVCAVIMVAAGGACRSSNPTVTLDLIHELPNAERRAPGDINAAIRVDRAGPPDAERPSILMTAPARVTWSLRIPPHAHLTTAIRLTSLTDAPNQGVSVRVGISDNRIYEQVAGAVASASDWQTVDVDLSRYSGFQWSLFYHPSNTTWHLVFSADATPGGTVAWAEPLIR